MVCRNVHRVHSFWGHCWRHRFNICMCDATSYFKEMLVNIFPLCLKSKDHLFPNPNQVFFVPNITRRLEHQFNIHQQRILKFQHIEHNVYIKKCILHTPTCTLWVGLKIQVRRTSWSGRDIKVEPRWLCRVQHDSPDTKTSSEWLKKK